MKALCEFTSASSLEVDGVTIGSGGDHGTPKTHSGCQREREHCPLMTSASPSLGVVHIWLGKGHTENKW